MYNNANTYYPYRTYFIFGCFCAAMFVFAWFFVPETKGISLERMDDLFGVTELVEKVGGGDIPSHNASVSGQGRTGGAPKDAAATHVEDAETV